ncbi:hypothetical protein GO730_26185 [Spirosoma sp. HMF3257]|uniref:Uncharacterized protein n=2 Tax=Spirosoma telluris TaxID=2183553 RepID=A0A327NVB6_9BACT|nr:hypothetical protein [Spirosoma telluris]RAI76778.1 hypothetical protein HMF3257_26115 [Spirosoma telluris]
MSKAEDFSQQLQEHGQQLARIERLLAGQKETLTSVRAIPHYVDRAELASWLRRNRVKTVQEIEQEATTFIRAKGQKGGVSK